MYLERKKEGDTKFGVFHNVIIIDSNENERRFPDVISIDRYDSEGQ